MAKRTAKEPKVRSAPMVYSLSKVGLNVEELVSTLVATLREDPNWSVTKTEITDLKFLREKDHNKARIVGKLTLVLRCK